MLTPRIRAALVVLAASAGLGACTSLGPYGGVGVGVGSGYGSYGYGNTGYGYGSPYDCLLRRLPLLRLVRRLLLSGLGLLGLRPLGQGVRDDRQAQAPLGQHARQGAPGARRPGDRPGQGELERLQQAGPGRGAGGRHRHRQRPGRPELVRQIVEARRSQAQAERRQVQAERQQVRSEQRASARQQIIERRESRRATKSADD